MPSMEAIEQYQKAFKAAQKEYKELLAAEKHPHPAVLDDILPEGLGNSCQPIGLVEIPAHRIVGTKSAGRITAFTPSFLPLLEPGTEFASKWTALCDAHLSPVGIREPIECFEYLGNFYVQEGNKRVSVLRNFDAARIPGNVQRILPPVSDDPEVVAYYEFLEFFKDARTYEVRYRTPGNYAKLLSALGREPGIAWTQWEIRTFHSHLQYFRDAYEALGGSKLSLTAEEALLVWLEVFTFRDLGQMTDNELKKALRGLWDDLVALSSETPVQLSTDPVTQKVKTGLLSWFTSTPGHLSIAFIHQMDPTTSTWTGGHEFGIHNLKRRLKDKITVRSYFHADSPEQTSRLLELAVEDGADLVFTTTPRLNRATVKAALKYPHIRFFNCSVAVPYSSVRSYYCRIFEGKFITGAIAGAMAGNDRIGYIGSYPIYGVPASVNAFALGAQMTNPRARIDLRWSCLGGEPVKEFIEKGYQVISNRDVPSPQRNYLAMGEYGTYLVEEDKSLTPLASPCWLWGNFYERIVRSILNGTWEQHTDSGVATNYWWGMDSGVIDVEFSKKLPESLRFLARSLSQALKHGALDPFFRRIVAQDGSVKNNGTRHFTPDELLRMDWLCDNIDGVIPPFEEVLPFAQPMLRELGVYKESIPPEKEEEDML